MDATTATTATTKFTAENKKKIHDILNYYDPFDVLKYFEHLDRRMYYDEYRGYINKIIRESYVGMTHDNMWEVCLNVLHFEEKQYLEMYEMVDELCAVFA